MKHITFILPVLIMLAGCGGHVAERPDTERSDEEYTYSFDIDNTRIVLVGGVQTFSLAVLRGGAALDAPSEAVVKASGACGAIADSVQSMRFAEGQISARAQFSIDADALEKSSKVEFSIDGGTAVYIDFIVERPIAPTLAYYRRGNRTETVEIDKINEGNIVYYIVRGEGMNRRIRLAGAEVVLEAGSDEKGPVCDAALTDAVYADIPAMHARSNYDIEENRFNIVAARPDGSVDAEYLMISRNEEWEDVPCIFTDGWFLPVVWFQAQIFEPADYPWSVWMQRHTGRPAYYRVIDLYRGLCPLSAANSADAGITLYIDASDSDYVLIAPQQSGFANPDIFPDGAVIADFGGLYGPEKRAEGIAGRANSIIYESEGGISIRIRRPMRRQSAGWEANKRSYESLFVIKNE